MAQPAVMPYREKSKPKSFDERDDEAGAMMAAKKREGNRAGADDAMWGGT